MGGARASPRTGQPLGRAAGLALQPGPVHAKLRGPLRVSLPDFVFCVFGSVFSSFAERYPGIELTLSSDYREVSLPRREADVVLRLSNTPAEPLVGRRVRGVSFAVYAADGLIQERLRGAGYADYPWIGRDLRQRVRAFMEHVANALVERLEPT